MTAGAFYYNARTPYDDIKVSDFDTENVDIEGNANQVRQVIYAAVAGGCHVITWIQWGYEGAQGGGYLRIDYGNGTALVFTVPITSMGAGFEPIFGRAPVNTPVRVTLGPGGAGVTGFLNVGHRVERPPEEM